MSMLASLGSLIYLAGTVFWIVMIVHCIANRNLSGSIKLLWLVGLFFLNWIAALAYFFIAGPGSGYRKQTVYYMKPTITYKPPVPYYRPPQNNQPQQRYQAAQQANAHPPVQHYQDGYKAAQRQEETNQEPISAWTDYEEPQTSYPYQEFPLQ